MMTTNPAHLHNQLNKAGLIFLPTGKLKGPNGSIYKLEIQLAGGAWKTVDQVYLDQLKVTQNIAKVQEAVTRLLQTIQVSNFYQVECHLDHYDVIESRASPKVTKTCDDPTYAKSVQTIASIVAYHNNRIEEMYQEGMAPLMRQKDVAMLQQAAQGGHLEAQLEMGRMHLKEGRRAEAEAFYQKAAEQDSIAACLALAKMHDEDKAQTKEWLEKALKIQPKSYREKNLQIEAHYLAAWAIMEVDEDFDRALAILEEISKTTHLYAFDANYVLGRDSLYGIHHPQDSAKAKQHFEKSREMMLKVHHRTEKQQRLLDEIERELKKIDTPIKSPVPRQDHFTVIGKDDPKPRKWYEFWRKKEEKPKPEIHTVERNVFNSIPNDDL